MALTLVGWCFFIVYNKGVKEMLMILKDKEVINLLKSIDRKLDMLILMKKSDKMKRISKQIGGKENV